MGITNWSIRHSTTIFVLMFIIFIAGVASYLSLPREAAPQIDIPYVIVVTPYFGVSPEDIESLVTNPVEAELEQIKDVRSIQSTSAESASMVFIEFEPTVEMNEALQRVRDRVDAAKSELPSDAEDPMIQEISFEDFPVMVINISGDEGLARLRLLAEDLQDRIDQISGVLDVEIVGGVEREISVEVDRDLLAYYGVSLGEIINVIQMENINIPGGSIDVGDSRFLVRIPGEFETVREIEDLVVRQVEGQAIYVKDLAIVDDGYKDQETYARFNQIQSVSLSITRRSGTNTLEVTDAIKAVVNEFSAEIGEGITFTILADESDMIRDLVSELENNILTGLILVILLQFLFMGGVRNAVFVAVAVPMSMLLTFIVLKMLGITLNMVVLFSLVFALGMLVDNAIVIVENIFRLVGMGKPLGEAARDGVTEVGWPVIASTGTTVGAFFPLMFWPGIMGSFMKFLPITVVVVLLSSLFVALVINPVLCAKFMRKGKGQEVDLDEYGLTPLPNNWFYRLYGAILRFSLSQRLVVIVLALGVFIATFAVYGKNNAGTEFMSETTPEHIYVNIVLPDGSNVDASDRIVRFVEQALSSEENVKNFVANVGSGTGDFFSGGSTTPHQSQISVDLLPIEDQVEDPDLTIDRVRSAIIEIPGAEFEVIEEVMGPPTGYPINIEVAGEDYLQLGAVAAEVTAIIRHVPGVVDIKDDFETGRSEIAIDIDRRQARLNNASTIAIAQTVRAAINGVEASVFREGDDEYDIVVRLSETGRDTVEDLDDLLIPTMFGDMIQLSELADLEVRRAFGSIRHIDGEPVVTVSSDVGPGFNANAVLAEVQKKLDESLDPPSGVTVRYTGANEMQKEASEFLAQALLGALFIIVLILVTQFNSVSQPTIIMSAVVLSVLGVFLNLIIRNAPFSIILTGMAIISLAGVVVNNSIVLISFINDHKAKGLKTRDAVYRSGILRLRPVLLTAVTTSSALLPTMLGFNISIREMEINTGGTSVEFWGPMANAVVTGLLVASALTLIVVPVLYSSIDSFGGFIRRLFGLAGRDSS